MLDVIFQQKEANDGLNEQIPILLEKIKTLNATGQKRDELIKTQDNCIQKMEKQILDLQGEMNDKEMMMRKMNLTIMEQKNYILQGENQNDDGDSLASGLTPSAVWRIKNNCGTIHDYKMQHEDDLETIEDLKNDIGHILREYENVEKQRDDFEIKYEEICTKNHELIEEINSLESVMEDQDSQISMMRERLQTEFVAEKQNVYFGNQMELLKKNLRLDISGSDLDKSDDLIEQCEFEQCQTGRKSVMTVQSPIQRTGRISLRDSLNPLSTSCNIVMENSETRQGSMREQELTPIRSKRTNFFIPKGQNFGDDFCMGSTTADSDSKNPSSLASSRRPSFVFGTKEALFNGENSCKSTFDSQDEQEIAMNTSTENFNDGNSELELPKTHVKENEQRCSTFRMARDNVEDGK